MPKVGFDEWRRKLARTVNHKLGVSMNKLPDFPIKQWWKDEIPVEEAVEIIREELGAPDYYEEDSYSYNNHEKLQKTVKYLD